MAYVTLSQLQDRYGDALLVSLTDRAAVPTGSIDTDVVDRAIADASAQIDGYLAARYALPMASVPALLVDLTAALTIWKLHLYDPPQKMRDDRDGALKMLENIARGLVTLEIAGVEPEGSGSGGVQITDRERPLTADNLKGFI